MFSRRELVLAGIGAAVSPSLALAQDQEWTHSFIQAWMHGSWRVNDGSKLSLLEFYSHVASHSERGTYTLRAGAGDFDKVPVAVKMATARPERNQAKVAVTTDIGRLELLWRPADEQEGVLVDLSGARHTVKLTRQSSAQIEGQREKALAGQKPVFINTSYFG
jgi:hypothetical protein